jgi:hypothetical protein
VRFALAVSLFLVFLLPAHREAFGATVPLDSEAVFCLYFRMSREYMEDQDLEELCASRGRPTFTAYKPAEMFTKKTLVKMRKAFTARLEDYENAPVFTWQVDFLLIPGSKGREGCRIRFEDILLPRATPFIGSRISEKGWREIGRRLKRAAEAAGMGPKRIRSRAHIHLVPKGIVRKTKRRNIALETVHLPHRWVVFQPVRVEVLSPGTSGKQHN